MKRYEIKWKIAWQIRKNMKIWKFSSRTECPAETHEYFLQLLMRGLHFCASSFILTSSILSPAKQCGNGKHNYITLTSLKPVSLLQQDTRMDGLIGRLCGVVHYLIYLGRHFPTTEWVGRVLSVVVLYFSEDSLWLNGGSLWLSGRLLQFSSRLSQCKICSTSQAKRTDADAVRSSLPRSGCNTRILETVERT